MNQKRIKKIIINENIYDKFGRIYIAKGRVVTLDHRSIYRFKQMGIWDQITKNIWKENYQELALKKEVKQIGEKYGRLNINKLDKSIEFVQKIIFGEKIFKKYPYLNTMLEHSKLCYTHSINVTILSVLLAETVGYDEQTIRKIAIGALLHDIGYIFIPKEIIEKEDSELTEEELQLKHKHCSLGFLTMKSLNIPSKSLKIIEQHHERLDGTGYPNKLKKQEILEEAYIVCIAEELDNRTSDGLDGGAMDVAQTIEDMYNLPEKYSRRFTQVLKNIFDI